MNNREQAARVLGENFDFIFQCDDPTFNSSKPSKNQVPKFFDTFHDELLDFMANDLEVRRGITFTRLWGYGT